MPIVTDKKKFSFEFFYEFEGEDGQTQTFPIKYLWGTYGPTIQVFFGEGQGVELPADIFGEIANFLVQQGILAPAIAQRQIPNMPPVGGKPMAVPLLKGATAGIIAMRQPQPQATQQTPTVINPLAPQASMSQTINPLAPRGQEVSALGSQPNEVPSLSNEEIIAARLAAKEKAMREGVVNKFRKGHVEGAYVPDDPITKSRKATEAANDTDTAEDI